MLGDKRVMEELFAFQNHNDARYAEINKRIDSLVEQLDRIESKLDARAKLKSEAPKPEQFMGDNGLYSYKNWEEKMKDKYLKRHN